MAVPVLNEEEFPPDVVKDIPKVEFPGEFSTVGIGIPNMLSDLDGPKRSAEEWFNFYVICILNNYIQYSADLYGI